MMYKKLKDRILRPVTSSVSSVGSANDRELCELVSPGRPVPVFQARGYVDGGSRFHLDLLVVRNDDPSALQDPDILVTFVAVPGPHHAGWKVDDGDAQPSGPSLAAGDTPDLRPSLDLPDREFIYVYDL